MNWERIKGNWKQTKGRLRLKWGELTDDQVDVIEGRRYLLLGKLQEAYGVSADEAERQVSEWEGTAFEDDDALESDPTRRRAV